MNDAGSPTGVTLSKAAGARSYESLLEENIAVWSRSFEDSEGKGATFKDIETMINELRAECADDESGDIANSIRTPFNLVRGQALIQDDLPELYAAVKKLVSSTYTDADTYTKDEKKICSAIDNFKKELDKICADKCSVRLSYFLEISEDLLDVCKKIASESKKQDPHNVRSISNTLCTYLESIGSKIDERTEELGGEELKCLQLQYTDCKKLTHLLITCAKISVDKMYGEMSRELI